MNESISSLIKALGEAVSAELADYEGRAIAAEARETALRNGLQDLLNGLTSRPMARSTPIAKPEDQPVPAPQRKAKCPDALLIGALSENWSRAADVKRCVERHGIKVADGTIYNRMRKLVGERPDIIEATRKPERWRLTAQSPHRDFPDAGIAAVAVTANKRPQPDARAKQISPLNTGDNDNMGTVHSPLLVKGDCLDAMKVIPDASVNLILADLPYGITRLDIDRRIDMVELWHHFRRILKPNGNIVLFSAQPFTTALINAAPDLFRYPMVWQKNRPSHFLHSKNRPLGYHEEVLVFNFLGSDSRTSGRNATFNPQGVIPVTRVAKRRKNPETMGSKIMGHKAGEPFVSVTNCPGTILDFPLDRVGPDEDRRVFAKPIDLLAYLIRSYSNAGETVLDCTMGTGSTIIAAIRTGRNAIGMEIDGSRYQQAERRIRDEMSVSATRPRAG